MTSDDERVERSLAVLARGARSGPWRDAAGVRSLATRRRRVAWAGSVVVGVMVATVVGIAVLPSRHRNQPPLRVAAGLAVGDRSGTGIQLVSKVTPSGAEPDVAAERAVAHAEQVFTLALLRESNRTGGNANVVLSPSSLAVALSMLQNGAAGPTRDEISAALRSSALTNRVQDAGWSTLTADLAAAATKSGVALQSANSLWLQKNLPMGPNFMSVLSHYFRAGVWQVDFTHDLPGAERALNDWVATQTRGRITSLFKPGDLDRTTLLVLANAVYFKADWQTPFDARLTANRPFHAVGSTATVPFMSSNPEGPRLGALSTAALDAVQLPYVGGRFAALAVMPKTGTLAEFVDGLSADGLTRLVQSLQPQAVSLTMPRFTLDNYVNLHSILSGLGMPTAFTDGADFSALSPVPMKLQSAVQRAFLQVGERGTTAGAVTGLSGQAMSLPLSIPILLDHPFLFLVRDTRTGAILFSAQVQNPA